MKEAAAAEGGRRAAAPRTRALNRRRRMRAAIVAAWWLLASSDLGAQSPPLRLEPCRDQALATLLCGSLAVPEKDPGGRSISLHVVLVPALQPRDGVVPLFHIEGGPGVAATNAAPFYAGPGREYRKDRPVVLVDQRGTGGSSALRCPALESRDPLQEIYDVQSARACRAVLEERADLGQYGSEAAARDIDRVRAALGYAQVDLWALSYGTQLAQVYLKRFPGRVRSAVLVGVAPLDLKTPLYHAAGAQRVLDLIFDDCQTDPACSAAYPDLRMEWQRLLERLDQQPLRVRRRSASGKDGDTALEIRRGPFGEAFRGLLATTSGQRQIPMVIHRAAAGDFEPFIALLPRDSTVFAEGLYLSVTCAEGTARIEPAEIARLTAGTFLGDYRIRQQAAACRQWPQPHLPPDFFAAPSADVPVLVVSGAMDHVTPPRFAEELCGALPRCRLVSVPHLAHGPFDLDRWQGGDCLDRLINAFYAQPEPAKLDASCIYGMRPPRFTVPPSR